MALAVSTSCGSHRLMHRILSLMLCILMLTACGTHVTSIVETTVNTVDKDLIVQGVDIYRENYCGLCHTLTIARTRGTFGPSHDTVMEAANEYWHPTHIQGRQHLPLNTFTRAYYNLTYSTHRALRQLIIICLHMCTCQKPMSTP